MRRLSGATEEVMCALVMLKSVPNGEILSGRNAVGRDGVGSFVEVHFSEQMKPTLALLA